MRTFKIQGFLRTVWFLIYINKNRTLSDFSHNDVRDILNKTMNLNILLTGNEIERLYATANDDSKPLITVLALALYKSKSNDDDIDFKFRLSLSKLFWRNSMVILSLILNGFFRPLLR